MSYSKELSKGIFWSAIEKYSGFFISLIISSVLARLITPEDFGIVSIAMVIINFLVLFTDLGIGPAIIQDKSLTKKNLDSIFTFTIAGGLLLAIVLFILAPFIGQYYHNSLLIHISRILSIQVFFSALNIVPHAEMAKNKEFKLIAKRTLTLQVITGIISIIIAMRTRSIYTLLISPVVTTIGIFIYNLKYYPRSIDFTFDLKPLKSIFSFSSYQFLFGFNAYFSRNIDNILIGKYMDLSILGYYDRAYRLMLLPVQNISFVIAPVLQPILSSLQDNKEELTNKFNKILSIVAVISFPLGIYCSFTGREFITIFYGNNWTASIPIFEILAISLPLQIINSITGAIYQSANATKVLFYNGLLNTLITIFSFFIAVHYYRTLNAIAWAWTIAVYIGFITNMYMLYEFALKSKVITIITILSKIILVNIIALIIMILISKIYMANIFFSLTVKTIIFFVSYLFLIQIFHVHDLNQVFIKLKSFVNKKNGK